MTLHASILVVDDDPDVLKAARLLLRQHFDRVETTEDPAEIESLMRKSPIDVFLVDMNFAIGRNTGAEGLHWLGRILMLDPDAVVVLMTAFGDLNVAVKAMREGAADFVLKPWQNDKLVATLSVAAKLRQTRTRVNALSVLPPADDMIAGSSKMREVMNVVSRVAPTDANVLIRGENGTGKELIARALHRQSKRAASVFVTVDLGAVAESLFESELFGHMKGAFTDAVSDRPGRFQAADGGTLFLDEIGNLPAPLQTKLLRALESREVIPLGSDQPVSIDVRLISATNQPIDRLVSDGRFREDLLYRINTIDIELPPLRERLDDLPDLIEHFISLYARKYSLPAKPVTANALTALRGHHWPGNVRELSHAIERALILSDGVELDAADFRLLKGDTGSEATLNLDENERRMVSLALERAGGNISHAAAALGITRSALYRRIEKHGL
ncbi:MAG: sigma-54 dependent transcriptional regulator [Gammaproteobacteria bacterium]|nr:sigma-54 dependent transcriptional regulator [Gammaproteobacteria bacterium]